MVQAKLAGAKLCGAKLKGANLTGADLVNTDLTGATYTENTRWPEGFNPPSEAKFIEIVHSGQRNTDATAHLEDAQLKQSLQNVKNLDNQSKKMSQSLLDEVNSSVTTTDDTME